MITNIEFFYISFRLKKNLLKNPSLKITKADWPISRKQAFDWLKLPCTYGNFQPIRSQDSTYQPISSRVAANANFSNFLSVPAATIFLLRIQNNSSFFCFPNIYNTMSLFHRKCYIVSIIFKNSAPPFDPFFYSVIQILCLSIL